MSHSNQPLWAKQLGYKLDPDEQTRAGEHPAATPPGDNRCLLLDLHAELKNHIYGFLAPNVNKAYLKGKTFTCIHPLVSTCKVLRREFSGFVENQLPNTLTSITAQVEDFRFGTLSTKLESQLEPGAGSPKVKVKIHHIITSPNIDDKPLLKWCNTLAPRWWLRTIHKVRDMPMPDTRDRFIDDLYMICMTPDEDVKCAPELAYIAHGFTLWWNKGAGKYDFISPEDLKRTKINLPKYLETIEYEPADEFCAFEDPRAELAEMGGMDLDSDNETEMDEDTDEELDDESDTEMEEDLQ